MNFSPYYSLTVIVQNNCKILITEEADLRGIWEIPVLTNFSVNLKLKKNKVYLKTKEYKSFGSRKSRENVWKCWRLCRNLRQQHNVLCGGNIVNKV